MKAVMLMYDTLTRNYLPNYGCDFSIMPNFKRLAQKTVTFDEFYGGSMPCMPARRELHTGKYNFLHRGWGPLEPYDDSLPEALSKNGIYTHLATDHYVGVPFTLPAIIKVFFMSMDWRAVVVYLVSAVVCVLIMIPFIKKYDAKLLAQEKEAEAE